MTEFDFADCRDRLRRATEIVIDAEQAYEKAIERGADAEAYYRVAVGKAFEKHRTEGAAVEAALTAARAECAVHSRERDFSAGTTKLAAEKLEDARDSRRSLWRLIEWARERDLILMRGDGKGGQS